MGCVENKLQISFSSLILHKLLKSYIYSECRKYKLSFAGSLTTFLFRKRNWPIASQVTSFKMPRSTAQATIDTEHLKANCNTTWSEVKLPLFPKMKTGFRVLVSFWAVCLHMTVTADNDGEAYYYEYLCAGVKNQGVVAQIIGLFGGKNLLVTSYQRKILHSLICIMFKTFIT